VCALASQNYPVLGLQPDLYLPNRITPAFRDCPSDIGMQIMLQDSQPPEMDIGDSVCSFSIIHRFDQYFSEHGLPPRRPVHLTPTDFPLYFLRRVPGKGTPALPTTTTLPNGPSTTAAPPSPWSERCCGLDDASSDALFWHWVTMSPGPIGSPSKSDGSMGKAPSVLMERPERLIAVMCMPGVIELWQPTDCPHAHVAPSLEVLACAECPVHALVRIGSTTLAQLAFNRDAPIVRVLHSLALATGLLRLPERAFPINDLHMKLLARTASDMRNDVVARTSAAYNSEGTMVGFLSAEGECAVDVADGTVLSVSVPAAASPPLSPAAEAIRRPSTLGSAWLRAPRSSTAPVPSTSAPDAASAADIVLPPTANSSILFPHFAGLLCVYCSKFGTWMAMSFSVSCFSAM